MPAAVLGTMMPDKHNATLTSGRMVQICGLVQSPQFNDLRGEIVSHTHNERWIVKLQDGTNIALKRSNVQTLSPPPADYDMPTHILPSVSSAIYEPASANTPAPTPSPTNTVDNMPKPSAHTLNHSPTSLATLPRMRWSQWDYIAYQEQEDTPGAATQNTTHDKDERSWWAEPGNGSQWQQVVEWKQTEYRTHKWQENIRSVATRNMYQEYEENTEWEPIPTEPTPSTPEGPPSTLRQSPLPSPRAPPSDHPTARPPSDHHPPRLPSPDEKGITLHEDRRRYQVTLTCTGCRIRHKTEWGAGDEPYQALRQLGWTRGKDASGNLTWQRAKCPTYYSNCAETQSTQNQLELTQ